MFIKNNRIKSESQAYYVTPGTSSGDPGDQWFWLIDFHGPLVHEGDPRAEKD